MNRKEWARFALNMWMQRTGKRMSEKAERNYLRSVRRPKPRLKRRR